MARTNNLTNFLTDVASAIKTKKGSEVDIPAANFDTEIANLPSQGTYQQKTVSVTQNGNTTVIPDSGYDAIDQLTINTAVPEKQLQTKSYSFTQNANLELNPDTGYDGFSQVNLNINVPSSGGGDVKLFTTEQAMQADPSPTVGDLALVYGQRLQPVNADTEFNVCKFPNTVVLDSAFSGDASAGFRSTEEGTYYDGDAYLTDSSFEFNAWGEETLQISYTSQDGITYTRTDGGEEIVTLEGTIKFYSWDPVEDPFPEVIGNFMQANSYYLGGVFEYRTDSNSNAYITNIAYDDINNEITYDTNTKIPFDISTYADTSSDYKIATVDSVDLEGNPTQISQYEGVSSTITYNGHTYIGDTYTSPRTVNVKTYDLINETETITTVTATQITYNNQQFNIYPNTEDCTWFMPPVYDSVYLYVYDSSGNRYDVNLKQPSYYEIKYWPANTQLTLNSTNKLLPNVTALGEDGVYTGDGTIYDNLDWQVILNQYDLSPTYDHYIYPVEDNLPPIITYNHNSSNYNNIAVYSLYQTNLGVTFPDHTHSYCVKIADNQYFLCVSNNYKIATISNVSPYVTSETITNTTGVSGTIYWVTYDSTNNFAYCLIQDSSYTIYINKVDLTNKTITTLTSYSDNGRITSSIISIQNEAAYIRTYYAGFFKLSFSGTKTMISSNAVDDLWFHLSSKYIMTRHTGSPEIYDVENESWTGISPGNDKIYRGALITVGEKTYMFENNSDTVKVIENGSVTTTISLGMTLTRWSSTIYRRVF